MVSKLLNFIAKVSEQSFAILCYRGIMGSSITNIYINTVKNNNNVNINQKKSEISYFMIRFSL